MSKAHEYGWGKVITGVEGVINQGTPTSGPKNEVLPPVRPAFLRKLFYDLFGQGWEEAGANKERYDPTSEQTIQAPPSDRPVFLRRTLHKLIGLWEDRGARRPR